MPPRPRPRHRLAQRILQEHNENQLSDVDLPRRIFPHTSTPARPPPRKVRQPILTRTEQSILPPSSPPSLSSPNRRIAEFEPIASPVQDDPFGFLATERRLKQRAQSRAASKRGENRVGATSRLGTPASKHPGANVNDRTATPISDGLPAFATPPRPLTDSDAELELDLSTFISGTHTPPGHMPEPCAATPRHRRPKRKRIPSTPATQEEEPLPMPQTPSPMKRLSVGTGTDSARRAFADVAHLGNSPVKKVGTMIKRKKGGGKSGPAPKKCKTDETLAEEELKGMTDELRELLPSRPKRKAGQRRSSGARTKRAVRTGGKKGKTKQSAKRVKGREGEEREGYEKDREARREYFKLVDEYVMAEESVYDV